METSPRRWGWSVAVAVALGVLLAYLFVASRSTLFDRDEARFARAAVEMVRSGNYLYPTFNGRLRPDKPILIYWLMSLPLRLLGVGEVSVRLFSALGVAGAALLTYGIGKRLISPRGGVTAMAVMATTPLLLMIGAAATSDGVLIFFLTACLAIWARALDRGGLRLSDAPLLGLAMAGATLTKGPPGLAVPVLGIITSAAMLRFLPATRGPFPRPGEVDTARTVPGEGGSGLAGGANKDAPTNLSIPSSQPSPKGRGGALPLVLASVLALALFLAWAVPANNATGGQYAAIGLGKHVLHRMVEPMEGHGGRGAAYFLSLFIYIPVVIVGFFPWTLFLPGAIAAVWNGRVGGARGRALLVGWAAPTFILMSLVATKLPHYIAPIWPVLALMVAGTIETARRTNDAARGLSPREKTLLHRGGILFAPVALGAAALLAGGPWLIPAPALRGPGAFAAVAILVVAGLALRLHLNRRWPEVMTTLIIGMVMVDLLVAALLLPAFETIKLAPRIAAAIRARTEADSPVVEHDFAEPSLNFYLNRGSIETLNRAGLAAWLARPGPGTLVISRSSLAILEREHGPLGLEEIAAVKGINYSNWREMDLVALVRKQGEK